MLKHDKMYRVVVSTLAVMLVASFLLAAASFVALPSAQAATCDSCTWTNPSCNTAILSQFSQSAEVVKPKQKSRLAAQWETRCTAKRL